MMKKWVIAFVLMVAVTSGEVMSNQQQTADYAPPIGFTAITIAS